MKRIEVITFKKMLEEETGGMKRIQMITFTNPKMPVKKSDAETEVNPAEAKMTGAK